MRDFTEHSATAALIDRLQACPDPRLLAVMVAFGRHLHDFVREVRPTGPEWAAAVDFLTRTGQMCNDKRQEWILFSDIMGVSMLVDAINHPGDSSVTESTVLGPFHVGGAPLMPHGTSINLDKRGRPCVVSGRVVDPEGRPVAGALLDVWQTTEEGFYDVQQPDTQPEGNLRGKFQTDLDGKFWFVSVKPAFYSIPDDGPVGALLRATSRHPFRPAHIHFIVTAPGFQPVTTHIFAAGDRYLDSDSVFGVKSSLVEVFVENTSAADAVARGVTAPFWTVSHDFVLAHAQQAAVPSDGNALRPNGLASAGRDAHV